MPETNRFVLNPIRVTMPPRMEAKESGIIRREGDCPSRDASACMIGMKITTTGVLFMNPLTTSTATKARPVASAVCPRP